MSPVKPLYISKDPRFALNILAIVCLCCFSVRYFIYSRHVAIDALFFDSELSQLTSRPLPTVASRIVDF